MLVSLGDVYTAAARREVMRGQETRELVGLGDLPWSVATPIDFTPDAGTGVLQPKFQDSEPGTVLDAPGTGVLQPEYLTDPAKVAAARSSSSVGAPFYKRSWFFPVAIGAVALVFLGGKKP